MLQNEYFDKALQVIHCLYQKFLTFRFIFKVSRIGLCSGGDRKVVESVSKGELLKRFSDKKEYV